jgi:hypothetical protein
MPVPFLLVSELKMNRIATAAVVGLGLTLSTTADAKKKDKKSPDHTQAVTIAPMKLIAPQALVEYERSLSKKTSFTAGVAFGTYNSLLQRLINSAASEVDASYTINEMGITGAYNYYFKNFNRGWYTGGAVEFSNYTGTIEGGGESDSSSWSQLRVGPQIGWKIATQKGFTFSVDTALGYGAAFGEVSESFAPRVSSSRVRLFGGLNMGWSF